MPIKALNASQKKRVALLEARLKTVTAKGDLAAAQIIVADLQDLLRPLGQEARLMQAKNRVYEAAIEKGELSFAETGLSGVRGKVSTTTRTYLEATVLLAICFLRKRDFAHARPLITEAITRIRNIGSETRRRKFHAHVIAKFEEEAVLGGLRETGSDVLNLELLQAESCELAENSTELQILAKLGQAAPRGTIELLETVGSYSRNLLTTTERKLLPSPEVRQDNESRGKTVFRALKTSAWKAVCEKESDLYKRWCSNSLDVIFSKRLIAGAIAGALGGLKIGYYTIALCTTALIVRVGLNAFCDAYRPEGIMEERDVPRMKRKDTEGS